MTAPAAGSGPSDAALLALGAGAVLAALELPLELGSLPLGGAVRALGGVVLAGALGALRGSAGARATTAAGLVALWTTLALLDLVAPAGERSAYYLLGPLLGALALLAAALLGARVLLTLADAAAWSYASRAWRRVHLVSLLGLGAVALALSGGLALSVAEGAALAPASYPLAALLGPLALALPAVSTASAAGWTARDRAQLARREPPALARLATRPAFVPLALAALLVLPWGASLPAAAHYLGTPTFAELVATRRGAARPPRLAGGVLRLTGWSGPVWEQAAGDGAGEAGGAATTVRHLLEVRLLHGREPLLEVTRELACTFPGGPRARPGARVHVVRASADPRFNLVVHTRVDLDGSGPGGPRVAFASWVGLASGTADMRLGGERVRGLGLAPPDAAEADARWADAADVARELALAPRPRPWLRVGGAGWPPGDRLPTAGEGLQYGVSVQGALEPGGAALPAVVPTRTRFVVNTQEYGYSVEVVETLAVEGGEARAPLTKRRRLHHEPTWNGAAW